MKIAVIPIDNRPVCYNLVKDIASIDKSIELFMPERKMLGDLTKIADVEGILNWFENLQKVDKVVVALDTIAYGGLIPSRRSADTFEEVKNRIEKFKEIIDKKKSKVYAFSSIMRISNNNVNVEEKPYWDKWGKKLFDYSYHTHKGGIESCITNHIPTAILEDYLDGRKRNFEINKLYLGWNFETLVYSMDDCAEYGFNVQEARVLEGLGGFVKTGADEIPLTLFARAIDGTFGVNPIFLEENSKDLISNYEDVSIEKSVNGQIDLAGLKIGKDIDLYINNFKVAQGEIVMKRGTEPFSSKFSPKNENYMIADVRFANGSDNAFVEQIKTLPKFGYSAWNTSANTLGSLICAAKVKFFAIKNNTYNDEAFKKLQTIRFLDDWAYQANVRQEISVPSDITDKMKPFEHKVFSLVKKNFVLQYKYPWNRLFEVEINVLD